jgi:hypothetical protein
MRMDASEVANHFLKLVEGARNQQAGGNNLVSALRLRYPDFKPENFGCLTVRSFMQKHVPDLKEIEQVGPDVIYGLRSNHNGGLPDADSETQSKELQSRPPAPSQHLLESSPEESTARPSSNDSRLRFPVRVWCTFSATESLDVVIANKTTGDLSVIPRSSSLPGGDWVTIQSLTRQHHIEIAKAFLDQVEEGDRHAVASLIGRPGAWWNDHYLNLVQLGLGSRWKQFHNDEIRKLFVDRLIAAGVPGMRHQARSSEAKAHDISARRNGSLGGATMTSQVIRKLALRIVAGMSASDLRSLKLTLGDVVDILEE